MPVEFERKYLVASSEWAEEAQSKQKIGQGYISVTDISTVRVRLADGVGTLTIKGAQVGIGRAEYEYEIPLAEAQEILESLTVGAVIKTRYTLNRTPGTWTVDVFEGKNEGLILLEVERSESFELEERPEWLGVEVTNDSRYKNAALSTYPISTWE